MQLFYQSNRKGNTMPPRENKSDYEKLTLELKPWTNKAGKSGETWSFNNANQGTIDCFGQKATISISKSGEEFKSAGAKVFIWLNDMQTQEHDAFVEEYGDSIYIHIPTQELLTVQQYDNLFNSTATQQTSSQPSTSF
jgi:hypothetical protein